MTRNVTGGLLLTMVAATSAAQAAIVEVPGDVATIQGAVDAALPGDTIRVAPGHYAESIRIEEGQNGLTIESVDPGQPFTLYGTRHKSVDGVRVDRVDGVTLRGFAIVGAYNGVRLNRVRNAVVMDLYLEDNALGVRVNAGEDNAVVGCSIVGTRVEQGIRVDGSPGVVVTDNHTMDTDEQGIRVLDSAGAIVVRNVVRDARGNDGIAVAKSPGARIVDCVATGSYHDGFRVARSPKLIFHGNHASGNPSVGIRIERCWPFQSIEDVVAAGNVATGNGQREIVVMGGNSCAAQGCVTTTTSPTSSTRASTTSTSSTSTSSTSTTATPTTVPPTTSTSTPEIPTTSTSTTASPTTSSTTATPTTLPGIATRRWRLYVRLATASGATNADVPRRSSNPPLEIAIAARRLDVFETGDRVSADEIAALGDDTLARLNAAAAAHVAQHPGDYPGVVEVRSLHWAMRVP